MYFCCVSHARTLHYPWISLYDHLLKVYQIILFFCLKVCKSIQNKTQILFQPLLSTVWSSPRLHFQLYLMFLISLSYCAPSSLKTRASVLYMGNCTLLLADLPIFKSSFEWHFLEEVYLNMSLTYSSSSALHWTYHNV